MPGYTQSDVRLFTDDSVLYREMSNVKDTDQLQKDLEVLENCEKTWMMRFIPTKCNAIRIQPKNKEQRTMQYPYTLHEHTLEPVDSAKYLGVSISNNFSWNKHIQNVTANGNRTLGFVKRNMYKRMSKVNKGCWLYNSRATCHRVCFYYMGPNQPTNQASIH